MSGIHPNGFNLAVTISRTAPPLIKPLNCSFGRKRRRKKKMMILIVMMMAATADRRETTVVMADVNDIANWKGCLG